MSESTLNRTSFSLEAELVLSGSAPKTKNTKLLKRSKFTYSGENKACSRQKNINNLVSEKIRDAHVVSLAGPDMLDIQELSKTIKIKSIQIVENVCSVYEKQEKTLRNWKTGVEECPKGLSGVPVLLYRDSLDSLPGDIKAQQFVSKHSAKSNNLILLMDYCQMYSQDKDKEIMDIAVMWKKYCSPRKPLNIIIITNFMSPYHLRYPDVDSRGVINLSNYIVNNHKLHSSRNYKSTKKEVGKLLEHWSDNFARKFRLTNFRKLQPFMYQSDSTKCCYYTTNTIKFII